jgi:hypothetical protein
MTSIYDLNAIHQKLRAARGKKTPAPQSIYDLNGVHNFMRAQKSSTRPSTQKSAK